LGQRSRSRNDDRENLVNSIDPEPLKGLNHKTCTNTIIGKQADYIFKVMGSKVKVIRVQMSECYNGGDIHFHDVASRLTCLLCVSSVGCSKTHANISGFSSRCRSFISVCNPTSHPRPTQPSIPPGSVNKYQLRLGRQRQVWFILLADERGVCR